VTFVNVVINENTKLDEREFDLVLAYEFYPFTRTTDWSMHKAYLDMCINNCNEGGYVVLGMPGSDGGICNNIMTENMDKVLEEYGNMYKGTYCVTGNQYIIVLKK